MKKNRHRLRFTAAFGLWSALAVMVSSAVGEEAKIVTLRPPELGFFSKQIVYEGIAIKAHKAVSDAALLEARRRMAQMLAQVPVVVQNLVDVEAELHVIGKDQQTSDLPYLRHWKGKAYETHGKISETIDQRTRGIGGVLASCGEENLLKLPSDRYTEHRDICTHEFAHTVFGYGLSPKVQNLVRTQYKKSIGDGLWRTAYAATNEDEFFAELSMWYFDSRGDYGDIKPAPHEGRAWLRQYDPRAFDVLDGIYSGRTVVERIAWENIASQPTKAEATLHSLSSNDPTKMVFANRSSSDYSLFWLDFAGKRQPYGTIHAGENVAQETFATHAWLIARPDGQAVGIYVPGKQHAKAVLR